MPSLFTSESVTEGHPDKLADQISDAILDAILAKDPLARVACEAIVTTGLVILVGPITLAHRLAHKLADVRRNKTLTYLRPDGKVQVTVRYSDDGKPEGVDNVVISTQHHDEVDVDQLRSDITQHVIDAVIPSQTRNGSPRSFINPTGRFVIGGPVADAGLTGRKVMVDTYG